MENIAIAAAIAGWIAFLSSWYVHWKESKRTAEFQLAYEGWKLKAEKREKETAFWKGKCGAPVKIVIDEGVNGRHRWFARDLKTDEYVGDCNPHGFETSVNALDHARKYWGPDVAFEFKALEDARKAEAEQEAKQKS